MLAVAIRSSIAVFIGMMMGPLAVSRQLRLLQLVLVSLLPVSTSVLKVTLLPGHLQD